MTDEKRTGAPVILFGAFDRHNFGDLLFPHLVAGMLDAADPIYAGLAGVDLRRYGGHRVAPLARLAADLGDRAVEIVHVGGELLTCTAWQAAVMLTPPEQVADIIRYLEKRPVERAAWLRDRLGVTALAPYTLSRQLFPRAVRVTYNAVGGVDLAGQEPPLRAEVLAKLRSADRVTVRDGLTLAQLQAAGIPASLVPDPAVMVAALFGQRIRRRARQGEVAGVLGAFPNGYLAVQFSADFGDDATLAELARQLDHAAAATGLAVVFFRAGAAPWHDDLACYRRTAERMRCRAVAIFQSLNIWDICALIAGCRVYCGSSLHGRIVAAAFALPRVNLRPPSPPESATKQAAYAATWEPPAMPAVVAVRNLAEAVSRALAVERRTLRRLARALVARYRQETPATQVR